MATPPGVQRNLVVVLVVAASAWLGVDSAHADFTLRCYDWRASAPWSARVEVSEGDSFVINVLWDGHSALNTWAVEWNTQRGSGGTATSDTDYEPRDDYRQTKRTSGDMNHTFSTIEDDRYEGDETYEAGYSIASGSGGHDLDRHEYCPVTIEDDDDLKVDSAWFNSTPADGHDRRAVLSRKLQSGYALPAFPAPAAPSPIPTPSDHLTPTTAVAVFCSALWSGFSPPLTGTLGVGLGDGLAVSTGQSMETEILA